MQRLLKKLRQQDCSQPKDIKDTPGALQAAEKLDWRIAFDVL
jgi:mRNA-degrading endonuclease HigB of HigAB toxin-antitoxin module